MASKKKKDGAKNGDRVLFHYTVKFTTGMVVNTTTNGEPVNMILGKGEAVEGLEDAIKGMKPGESKTVKVQAHKAFGPRLDELFIPTPRSQFPDRDFVVGETIEVTQPDGQIFPGKVRLVDDVMVMIDLNHPLAGHDLVYDITLIQVAPS